MGGLYLFTCWCSWQGPGAGESSFVSVGKASLKHCRKSPEVLIWAEFQEGGHVGTDMPPDEAGFGAGVNRL